MTNNIVPFGRPANDSTPEPESEAPTTVIAAVEDGDPMQQSIDSLIRLLQDNRHQIASFMGVLTLKENHAGASGYQLFTSPMSLADFSLGVRILDGAADAMLHGNLYGSRN